MAAKRSADSDTLLMAAVHDEIAPLFCGLFSNMHFADKECYNSPELHSSFFFRLSDVNFTLCCVVLGGEVKEKAEVKNSTGCV